MSQNYYCCCLPEYKYLSKHMLTSAAWWRQTVKREKEREKKKDKLPSFNVDVNDILTTDGLLQVKM